jgi:hypothetical protein
MSRTASIKQMAIRLAAQLPRDPEEAREVLRLTRKLVDEFMDTSQPTPELTVLNPERHDLA